MPEHCQMAVLMDFNRGLDDLYGSGRREANVKEMVDSPLPQMNSPTDKAMAYALSSSTKKDDDETNPESENNRQARQFEVNVSDDSIPGFVDASKFTPDAAVLTFVSNQEAQIAEQLRNMASENCANAFKAAGLKTPKEVVDRGITIFPAYLLNNVSDMSKIGLNSNSTDDSAFRNRMKDAYDSTAAAFTNDITTTPPGDYKGRVYMALLQRAFNETDGPFGVSFVHAMMHAAGAQGRGTHPETRWRYRIGITPEELSVTEETVEVANGRGQHDLSWMDKKLYDAIIENCAKK